MQFSPASTGSDKAKGDQKADGEAKPAESPAKPAAAPSGFSPSFAMGAPDALAEQLDLSYQIFNLRILNERSLSDRLYNGNTRMQVVLGFQISIDPPKGSEDCAAVVEIGLQLDGVDERVSVVAMIPQEKTYNAASLSSKADSIDGSVVAKVLRVGAKGSRQADQFYLHRDSDTIAFERDTRCESAAFGLRKPRTQAKTTVLGWEFRPVLGRRTVSPGTRQMLAVVALPCTDGQTQTLNLQSRGYWRSYERKTQSSKVRWRWWPFPARLGRYPAWSDSTLSIEPSVITESRLGPKIKRISWVNAGGGVAVVMLQGRNFFSGTEVTIGGQVHRSAETNLTIKSDHALEIRTTVAALNEGEAVLSGRFGPSVPLSINLATLPTKSISIETATFSVQPGDAFFRLALVIRAAEDGERISKHDLEKLPDPILYLNNQPLFGSYDYDDCDSAFAKGERRAGRWTNEPKDAVTVQAWAPKAVFQGAGSVITFKVPFCGAEWVASSVVRLPDGPSISTLSRDAAVTTLLIAVPPSVTPDWTALLDRTYTLGTPEFVRIDQQHLKLLAQNAALQGCSKVMLQNGTVATYLLDLTPAVPPPAPKLDPAQGTPTIVAGKNGVALWTGANLTRITGATIDAAGAPHYVHNNGEQVSVFVDALTATPGKHAVAFAFDGGTLTGAFFAVDAAS